MKKLTFYIIFFLAISILILTEGVRADDVYNFQFQKSQEGTPPTPAVVSPAPALSPSKPEKSTDWRYSVGYGFNKDLVGRVEGIVLGVGYNFNKYFGLNSTYLIKQKFIPEYHSYTNQDHLNKLDVGFNFTPFSVSSFELNLLEITFYAGITSTHNPPLYSTDGTPTMAREDYQGYIGLGINLNFTKDFSLEATTKTLANQIFPQNRIQHNAAECFTYISYNLVWKI